MYPADRFTLEHQTIREQLAALEQLIRQEPGCAAVRTAVAELCEPGRRRLRTGPGATTS